MQHQKFSRVSYVLLVPSVYGPPLSIPEAMQLGTSQSASQSASKQAKAMDSSCRRETTLKELQANVKKGRGGGGGDWGGKGMCQQHANGKRV